MLQVLKLLLEGISKEVRPHYWLSGSELELVDGRRRVQFSVALVDLVVRSYPWVFPKLA